jgi:hypothetical protein
LLDKDRIYLFVCAFHESETVYIGSYTCRYDSISIVSVNLMFSVVISMITYITIPTNYMLSFSEVYIITDFVKFP